MVASDSFQYAAAEKNDEILLCIYLRLDDCSIRDNYHAAYRLFLLTICRDKKIFAKIVLIK